MNDRSTSGSSLSCPSFLARLGTLLAVRSTPCHLAHTEAPPLKASLPPPLPPGGCAVDLVGIGCKGHFVAGRGGVGGGAALLHLSCSSEVCGAHVASLVVGIIRQYDKYTNNIVATTGVAPLVVLLFVSLLQYIVI
jgi:hypothetical protein